MEPHHYRKVAWVLEVPEEAILARGRCPVVIDGRIEPKVVRQPSA